MPYPVAAVRGKIQAPPIPRVNLVSNGTFDANIDGWTPYGAPSFIGTVWTNTQYHSSPGSMKVYYQDYPKYVLVLDPSVTKLFVKMWVKLPVFEEGAELSIAFGGVGPDFDWYVYAFTATDWISIEWTVNNDHALTELIINPPYLLGSEFIYVDNVEVYDISPGGSMAGLDFSLAANSQYLTIGV